MIKNTKKLQLVFGLTEIYNPREENDGPNRCIRVNKIRYYPGAILGEGSLSTKVFRGKIVEKAGARDIAVKRLVADLWANPDTETALLIRSDGHENIVRYHWSEQCKKYIYLALQLCDFNLQQYVEKAGSYPKIKELDIFIDAVKGLQHLHALNIMHRDLNPANILVYLTEGSCQARGVISDLGLSKVLTMNQHSVSVSVSVGGGWMAPELLRVIEYKLRNSDMKPSLKSDIFSMGNILHYVVSSGTHPFGDSSYKRKHNIMEGIYTEMKLDKDHPFYDLISSMLHHNPETRPTTAEILSHPAFQKPSKPIYNHTENNSERYEDSGMKISNSMTKIIDLNRKYNISSKQYF